MYTGVTENGSSSGFYCRHRKNRGGLSGGSQKDEIKNLSGYHLAKGDKICLDFGDHQVGYVTLKLNSVGSPQDAPAFF